MIKSFIYLDEQKMYSLSSQIFEGITDYILNEQSSITEETETQKGPVASGKILADVIKSSLKSTEKKFLHDYSYSIFEKHLTDEQKVLVVDEKNGFDSKIKSEMNKFSFIKVKSKAVFNDINEITDLFGNFNQRGEAIAHVTAFSRINEINTELASIQSKEQRTQLQSELKMLTNTPELAKKSNLYQDKKFLDNLTLLTKYGFSDQFEVQQSLDEILFSSSLRRELLREKEDILIKKYSRRTEREIVVFGIISQGITNVTNTPRNIETPKNMKEGLINMIEHLANVEISISGKQENEIVIDPIAVYIEI
ncbi:DUF6414 family protein [Undibacterium danionis]|uniref:Uncharacterized protein n=1 Tax=Undibacterium danionis TaxID=1812100 RepID=A0ABV6ICF3_9BURK